MPNQNNSKKLLKITYFLMLNSDVTFKYDLINDHHVSHLLNAIPKISTCLLLALVWQLHLDQYFYEIIAYTPTWFAFSFVEHSTDSLKYANPFETLERVEHLICAIYTNIARSDFREMEIVEKRIILNRYYDIAMDLLRHFFSPDAEKFENWTKKKYYKYSGFVCKHNLTMILFCFDLFLNKSKLNRKPSQEWFNLMIERENGGLSTDTNIEYSEPVHEMLHRLNVTMLNSLQNNTMQVDCNAFMYWVEVDFDEDTTLQRIVGESAYKLNQLINLHESFTHDVAAVLKTISIKPLTLEERIAQSTIGEMIDKLDRLSDDDEQVGAWLCGFIMRGELVLDNNECLETIESHIKCLTMEHLREIVKFIAKIDVENGGVIEEKLIDIFLNAFAEQNESDLIELIEFTFSLIKQPADCLQTEYFEQNIVETFNKIQFTRNAPAYYRLLVQNPNDFYAKVMNEAIRTEEQLTQMIALIQSTRKILRNHFDEHFDNLIVCESDRIDRGVMQRLPKFIAELFFAEIIDSNEFIVDKLYKNYLVTALKDNKLMRVNVIIETLLLIIKKFDFNGKFAPILILASQVLDICRWNLTNYNETALIVVTKSIDFIHEIQKQFLPIISDNDRKWIHGKTKNMDVLTKFYLQKFMPKQHEERSQNFVDFIRMYNQQTPLKLICEYIVRCTSKEIKLLADDSVLRAVFFDSIEMVLTIVQRSDDTSLIDGFRYSFNMFLNVVEV